MSHQPYPDDPRQHMLDIGFSHKHTTIDASYTFENRGLLYQLYAGSLRALALLLLPVYAKLTTGYRITGRENLRKVDGQGVVLVANHVCVMDAAIICSCANRRRKIRYVMLGSSVDIPVIGSIIKALGGIPLADNIGGHRQLMRELMDLLDRKKPILFFAEGALWPHYRGIRPFQKGAFVLAVRKQVPVLPLIITFETTRFGWQRLHLRVEEPLYPQGLSATQLRDKTQQLFEQTAAAFYKEHT